MTEVDPVVQRLQEKIEKKKQNYLEARSKKIDKVLREFLNKNGWNGTTVDAIRLMKGYAICLHSGGKVTIERSKPEDVTIGYHDPLDHEILEEMRKEKND